MPKQVAIWRHKGKEMACNWCPCPVKYCYKGAYRNPTLGATLLGEGLIYFSKLRFCLSRKPCFLDF